MKKRLLTHRQCEILEFLKTFTRENGYPPTVREVCAATGLKSPRSVTQHLEALERKGYIERGREKSRAIRFLRDPPTGESNSVVALRVEGQTVVGTNDARTPAESFCLRLDRRLVDGSNSFLLRVQGDSMNGTHIVDGDYIVVDPDPRATHGDLVVARVGGQTTVKRYEARPDGPYLVPDRVGRASGAIALPDADVELVGTVVGLIRQMNRARPRVTGRP